ncbi:MAG: GNAT family N-acetyltransferase [Bryobacterales bacterium]|nr:GNAT family N-acetyltransferase [Bryobacterales bacterium]
MQTVSVTFEPAAAPAQQAPDTAWFTLRPGRPEDAPALGRICYQAFKTVSESHNFPPDFPSVEAAVGLMRALLARPAVYSVVAESGGSVLGSNFLWLDAIAGVGPVTVDPAAQNGAVGRRLMQDVLDFARRQDFPGVRLVQAAYHNRSLSLYAKLGFVVREPLANMQGPAIGERIPGTEVRPAGTPDAEACNALCYRIHGHARPAELAEAIRRGVASVVVRGGRITGYTTGIGFFGHAVAQSNEDLKALIAAAPAFAGPGFLLPTRNAELFRWCLEKKLRVVQPMTLMTLGLYNEPAGAFLPSILY